MTAVSRVGETASVANGASKPVTVSVPVAASAPSAVKANPLVASVSASQPFVISVDSMPTEGALQYTQVIGTLVIAAIAAYITFVMQRRQVDIAHRAAKTAQHKLNLDLFDKRWKVYDAARRLIGTTIIHGKVTDEQLQVFLQGTQGANWLFDDGVAEYLKDFLYKHAVDLQTYVDEVPGLQGEQLTETRQKISDLKRLFQEELKLIDQRMGEFMRVVSA